MELAPEEQALLDERLSAFGAAWLRGESPAIEQALASLSPSLHGSAVGRMLASEIAARQRRGESPTLSEYSGRFPEHAALVAQLIAQGPVLESPGVSAPGVSTLSYGRSLSATDTWRGAPKFGADQLPTLPELPGYEILRPLGRGGMGYVVQARDIKLNRLVALKLPLPEKLRGPDARERFLREARAAAKLRHQGICPIYEIGESKGQPYLAMAYIEGEPLSTWAARHLPTGRQAADIVAKIAAAVQVAHDHGVVHRDLKPANVMIEHATGEPLLMDFGLAKDQTEDATHLTYDGDILGTPAYMSPEQAAGTVGLVGFSSDVYGLGGILYWLLCRRPPFSGTFGEIMRLVQTTEPVRPRKLQPGLHRDLETICLKAMAKEPRDRYASAALLADDLRRFFDGEAIHARPDGWVAKFWRAVRRRPGVAAAAVLLVVTLASAGWIAVAAQRESRLSRAVQAFDTALADEALTPARYEALEGQVTQLVELDPAAAARARDRLARRFHETLQQAMQRPSLTSESFSQIRSALEFYAEREPEAAETLKAEFDKRLRAWITLVDLRPPFANLETVFAPDAARVGEQPMIVPSVPVNPATEPGPAAALPESMVVSSLIPCQGNVELRATFPETTLLRARQLGLVFRFNGDQEYRFVLATAAPASDPTAETADAQAIERSTAVPRSLGAEIARGVPVELQIVRNGLVMRRQLIRLAGKDYEFAARRENDRLTVHVNGLPPLTFDDVLPLGLGGGGTLGVLLPPATGFTQFSASRQALPSAPSPLERGDFHFANQQFQEAFERYREQETDASLSVRQEARAKQGLCLLHLNRTEEAASLLEEVAGESGERWPIVAACHLWLLRLQQGKHEDAEVIRDVIASRYQFEQLALLLPDALRAAVVKEYLKAAQGTNLMTFNDERLARMERVLEIERLVHGRPSPISQTLLIRGYRALDRHEPARNLAAQLVDSPQEFELSLFDRTWLVEEYAWLLRLAGQAAQALEMVNRRLEPQPGAYVDEWLPLLVERARIHAALGDLSRAEADLKTLLERVPIGKLAYRHYSAARLLQGFLREEQGDQSGAQEAWQSGIYRVWFPEYDRSNDEAQKLDASDRPRYTAMLPEHPSQLSGVEFVQFVMLSSLSQQLNETEANRLFQWLTFRSGTAQDNTVLSSLSLLQRDLAFRTFRGVCQTPRGKRVARGVAYQTLGFGDFMKHPLFLMVYEVAHQGAFPQGLSDAQDQITWRAAEEAHAAYLAGNVSKTQLLGLTFTWKGQTGAFGWDGVAAGLDPVVRRHMAFIFGHRLVQLKRPQDAAKLFRVVQDDAQAEALLKSEVARELARIMAAP